MNSGTSFWLGLIAGLLVAFAVWSSTSDSNYEEQQSLEIDYQELESTAHKCVDSLKGEIHDLKNTILSTQSALSVATEPGFGYHPPYDDLLEAFEGANSAISNGSTFGVIHTECDF